MGHEFDGQQPEYPPGVTEEMINDLCLSEDEVEEMEQQAILSCNGIMLERGLQAGPGTRIIVFDRGTGEYIPVVGMEVRLDRRPKYIQVIVEG